MSQQVSPTHQRTHSGFGGSYSAACSPREPPRRSSIAVEGVGGMRPAASDDDDDDESEEERINSAESSCDGDIDADSMALDDTTNDAGSTRGVRLAGLRRQSVGSAPRNKAVVRLMSLVEEDRKPLASEMEHEGHITRSIRHSSVQEWLRSSSSSSSASVVLASPPLDDSARVAKPGMRMAAARAARDGEAGILFPASPASSAMSSPKLLAARPSSCPNTAGIVPAAVRLGKRKSLDDGDDDDSAGEPQAGPSSTVLARGPAYKRVAMSPSGLRAQVTFAKAGARRVLAHVAPRSGPSSPLLTSRPTLAGSLAATAGTCPPLGATRTRSRSGASLLTGPTGLNMVQTNGVFSRMNINDGDDDTDR
ncbi:hypothetical protein IWW50_006009 [Coemansia erecta]|nr:hypothetical protein IWW50_006009 [Coemansia erecta]